MNLNNALIALGLGLAGYLVYRLTTTGETLKQAGQNTAGYLFGVEGWSSSSLGGDLFDLINPSAGATAAGETHLKLSPKGYGVGINSSSGGDYITAVFDPAGQRWIGVTPQQISTAWRSWRPFARTQAADLPAVPNAKSDDRATVRNPADFGVFFPRY